MFDVNGFEVLDLGIDVPAQKFVDTIKETGNSEEVRLTNRSGVLPGQIPMEKTPWRPFNWREAG